MKSLVNINIEDFSDIMSLISQKNRLQIIYFLTKNGEKCVCEIYKNLDITQNLTSHHLALLKNIGLIKARREGKSMYYSINEIFYKELRTHIKKIFNF